ncbi:Multi antimicrobial extrusion protein [Corchorus olitorius]|uniref:Multi antimicrobial extrusion protein n=1 Tax=Corchorus olitorius TaxID=93759 RepID=A0A1R3KP82_9ROSI|nr:Multi antimicrobial extrusion protein [Corchorus olitorius]
MPSLSTTSLHYFIPYGFGAAASTRVSNEQGAGNPQVARVAVNVVIVLGVMDAMIVSIALFGYRHVFGYVYSNEKEVVDYKLFNPTSLYNLPCLCHGKLAYGFPLVTVLMAYADFGYVSLRVGVTLGKAMMTTVMETSIRGFNMFLMLENLVDAAEKGLDLCKQILELYRDYYHGGLMKLVVIGGEPLDVLQQWVIELFSDVRQGSKGKLEFKVEGPIWKAGKLYRVRKNLRMHVRDIDAAAVPCGFGRAIGNKVSTLTS